AAPAALTEHAVEGGTQRRLVRDPDAVIAVLGDHRAPDTNTSTDPTPADGSRGAGAGRPGRGRRTPRRARLGRPGTPAAGSDAPPAADGSADGASWRKGVAPPRPPHGAAPAPPVSPRNGRRGPGRTVFGRSPPTRPDLPFHRLPRFYALRVCSMPAPGWSGPLVAHVCVRSGRHHGVQTTARLARCRRPHRRHGPRPGPRPPRRHPHRAGPSPGRQRRLRHR